MDRLPPWVSPTARGAGASDIIRDDEAHVFNRVCGWEQIPLEEDVGRKAIIYISNQKHPLKMIGTEWLHS